MSYRTMHFPEMMINSIVSDGDTATIEIAYAVIVKNMDGAEQDTRWYGKGIMQISDLVIESDDFPELPAQVKSADVKNNQITYRNEVEIPIQFHGSVGITLSFNNFAQPIKFIGERMSFDLSEHEKYLEHIQ